MKAYTISQLISNNNEAKPQNLSITLNIVPECWWHQSAAVYVYRRSQNVTRLIPHLSRVRHGPVHQPAAMIFPSWERSLSYAKCRLPILYLICNQEKSVLHYAIYTNIEAPDEPEYPFSLIKSCTVSWSVHQTTSLFTPDSVDVPQRFLIC